MLPTTIDGVLEELDRTIATARQDESRLGYFPALYRKVTASVQRGIADGRFEDGERMERLDVIFANRYLDAIGKLRAGEAPSRSWAIAFEAAASRRPIVLQHLLLGMNAHINLDLGIAAARAAPSSELAGLHGDFNTINDVLGELVDGVKDELTVVWPKLALLDRLSGPADDAIANFSMGAARDLAWKTATKLAPLSHQQQRPLIAQSDRRVEILGRVIWKPGLVARAVGAFIRLGERGTVREIIDLLA